MPFNLVFTFLRKEKWLQIKLVLPSFAFILLLQPQECLSSHAADDQGQAHVCTSPHVSVLVLQMKSLSIFSHPTQSYLTPPPHLSSACDAVTSFLASADAVLSPTAKEFPENSQRTAVHLMCHRVSVYPAHTKLKISRFQSSSNSRWWREGRAREK